MLLAAGILLLSDVRVRAQSYAFSTLAGVGCGSADGTNAGARFFYPKGGAVDGSGNLYVADSGNHTIRKITPAGVTTTIAGLAGGSGSADGTNSTARFNNPCGLVMDPAGNLYVADSGNHTIRLITPAGVVTTIAGKAGNYGAVDGTNNVARFNQPMGIALDSATNLYVADTFNHTIREVQKNPVTSVWLVSTLAGQPGTNGGADGTNASFYYPRDLALDTNNNIYIADSANSAVRIIAAGVTGTFAGLAGQSGTNDGTNTAARFMHPCAITVDVAGNVYVVDGGSCAIRRITPAGVTSTVAGLPGVTGNTDGAGSAARFNYPCGVVVDGTGTNIYLADSGNNTIRKMTPAGVVNTLAGLAAGTYGTNDGTNATAAFLAAQAVAVDAAGNVYTADTGNHTIRKITAAGVVTTLAGVPGTNGTADGTNNTALFWRPAGIALDAATNLYVADNGNHTIRMVTPAGVVTTIAGQAGVPGYLDLPGKLARFMNPAGVAVDAGTNIYVADFGNAVIRKISPLGIVSTVAGLADATGYTDGTNTAARFAMPSGLAVDAATNLYVADTGNHTVRMITPGGMVSTLAGLAGYPGSADGVSNTARFYYPHGLALDSASNLFVADTFNSTIRKITPVRVVSTVAGTAGSLGVADDTGPGAQFYYPFGLAVDGASNLYVADVFNNSIRKGVPFLAPVLTSVLTNEIMAGGTTVTFRITALGAGTLSYQWQSNGVNISGATNTTLVINGATPYNANTYNVVVTDAYGSVTSQRAALSIVGPANDLFATPAVVAGTNFTLTASNVGASVESKEPNITGNPGGHSVWWSWQAPVDCTVTLDTSGSSFDTMLAVYKGAALASLTQIAANDDYTNLTSRVVFGAKGGVTYRFTVDGYNGATGAIQLNLAISAPVYPAITSQPQPQIDIVGANVALNVSATGSPPISYQWRKNSGNISGATGATLTLSGISSNSVANYSVVVSDELGTTNSATASLALTTGAGFNTLAGTAGYGSLDGVGAAARFHLPNDAASDAAGNIYVVDGANNTIRKVTPSGVVTTVAGFAGPGGYAEGTGTNALFSAPSGIVVDAFTNIYVSDSGNNLLRKITPAGVVSTLAGKGGGGGYADGTGTAAQFYGPSGLDVDAAGNIYLADAFNNLVRRITPAGVVSTVAGVPGARGSANGPATNATFYDPQGVAVDFYTNIYVADTGNSTIRKITPAGAVSILAGTPLATGGTDGTNAFFTGPEGIAVDPAGNVYVADTGNDTVRFITPGGVVSTVAGLAGVPGSRDGTNGAARFSGLSGVTVDPFWNVYVADVNNNTLRKVNLGGATTTVAGTAGSGANDGPAANARFNFPVGIAVDPAGNVYLADRVNSTIREINASGVVTTLAGVAGTTGSADGTNSSAQFFNPSGLAVDAATNLYVADTGNDTIRKVTPAGVVTTVAGSAGSIGSLNGVGTNARFLAPLAVTLDSQSNLLVADSGNGTIRKITPAGMVSTLAGIPGLFASIDGPATNALFGYPSGIAVDAASNIYVSDTGFLTIRRIGPDGTVSTLAGLAGTGGTVDGTGSTARFGYPYGLATDAAGNVLVADRANNTVRLVTPQGMVLTVAGSPGGAGNSDGVGTTAAFFAPQSVAIDTNGHYFVTDGGNFSVRTTRPPVPGLQISFAQNYAVLTWPLSATGYVIESSATPYFGSTWTPLTNLPVVIVGTNQVMSNSIGSPNLFYRLHKP